MNTNKEEHESSRRMEQRTEVIPPAQADADVKLKLSRWLVSFSSGDGWYSVGEYVALDAASAIERAIEVFGGAADYRAEEIPWDAAPLPKTTTPAVRRVRD